MALSHICLDFHNPTVRDIKRYLYGWNWSPQWPPGSSDAWLEVLSLSHCAGKPWEGPILTLSHTYMCTYCTFITHMGSVDGYYGFFQDLRLDRHQASGIERCACRPQETGPGLSLVSGSGFSIHMFQALPSTKCSESIHCMHVWRRRGWFIGPLE